MSIVRITSLKDIKNIDIGIELNKAFKLIEDFELKEELINKFDIDLDQNIFLKIKGAETLVEALLNLGNRVNKFDIDTEVKDIHISNINDMKQIEIDVFNISDPSLIAKFQSDKISAVSAYSVRNDLLDGLYKADKFLTHLKDSDFNDLVTTTISELEQLNSQNSLKKKLRYIENEDGELFVRAVTSTNVYKDYNINFSVFITLYQLNTLNNLGYSFEVDQFNFNESEISVLFKETNKVETINDNVFLSFALELTNSEIKSKAVKLNGNFIIQTENSSIYTKNNIKTTVLSIGHGYTIKTAKEYILSLPVNIDDYIENSLDSYKNIGKIKKFDDIQDYLSKKIQKSNNDEIKKYKPQLNNILKGRIKSLVELLEKMNKLEAIIEEEDIKAIDFLREKVYESIIKRGK